MTSNWISECRNGISIPKNPSNDILDISSWLFTSIFLDIPAYVFYAKFAGFFLHFQRILILEWNISNNFRVGNWFLKPERNIKNTGVHVLRISLTYWFRFSIRMIISICTDMFFLAGCFFRMKLPEPDICSNFNE